MALITFANKVDSQTTGVAEINKITASNINELKSGVNSNETAIINAATINAVKNSDNNFSSDQTFQEDVLIDGDLKTPTIKIGNASASIAGSLLTSTSLVEGNSIVANSFTDVSRVPTANSPSAETYADVSRVTVSGAFTDGGAVGSNQVGRHSGSGGAHFIYGNIVNSEQTGSGDIDYMIGSSIRSISKGDGAATIDYARGISVESKQNNALGTINNLQGAHITAALEEGSAGEVQVMLLDFDRINGTITNNFSYLQIQEDVGFHTVGGTARSIYSRNILPSEFNGDIISNKSVLAKTNKVQEITGAVTAASIGSDINVVTVDTSNNCVLTIETTTDVSKITVVNLSSTSTVSFTAGVGVTVNNNIGNIAHSGNFKAELIKISLNNWVIAQ